jgi:cell division septum initiation protein DivIVA
MVGGSDSDRKVQHAAVEGKAGAGKDGGWQEEAERISQRLPRSVVSRAERDQMVKKAREVRFPASVRGYDRAAVDRYVEETNRVIAELEISSSADSAVRHALAEVSEETREILQQAHETGDEIVLRARAKAAETVQDAEREAQEVRNAAEREAIETRDAMTHEAEELLSGSRREAAELRAAAESEATGLRATASQETGQIRASAETEADKLLRSATEKSERVLKSAETRARELVDSADLIWRERRRLIEDVRVLGEQLLALGDAEAKRFARPTAASTVSPDHAREAEMPEGDLAAALQGAVEENARSGT